jgi:polyhydroxyalkanoate synthesis regulator phasin
MNMNNQDFNVGIGFRALETGGGGHNIALGMWSLINANASAARNITIGSYAGGSVTSGSDNVIIGNNAAGNNGVAAMITTGIRNVVIGTEAQTVAYYSGAGQYNATENVVIGYRASAYGYTPLVSSGGIVIGARAFSTNAGIAIGYGSHAQSACVVIGHNITCAGGEVRLLNALWNGGGWAVASDRRVKENIRPMESGLETLLKLKPIEYGYKKEWQTDHPHNLGLIAQDVKEVLPDLVEGKEGDIKKQEVLRLKENQLIYLVIRAVQQIKALFDEDHDAWRSEVAALQEEVKKLQAEVKKLQASSQEAQP